MSKKRHLYELHVDKSTNLEIHFEQLNLLELFLFKNQKDLCQNNRCLVAGYLVTEHLTRVLGASSKLQTEVEKAKSH